MVSAPAYLENWEVQEHLQSLAAPECYPLPEFFLRRSSGTQNGISLIGHHRKGFLDSGLIRDSFTDPALEDKGDIVLMGVPAIAKPILADGLPALRRSNHVLDFPEP